MLRLAELLLVVGLAAGCGSNVPEIPPELLVSPGSCGSAGYPAGSPGTEEGDLLADASFLGWRDPRGADASSALETISFADFYDPEGQRGIELLLISGAAAWCSACREEHEVLPELYAEHRENGLAVLGLIFQDAQGEPATVELLASWGESFDTTFPLALDPEFRLGIYGSAEAAPINLIVDARTMVIERRIIGSQFTVVEDFISSELASRAAP